MGHPIPTASYANPNPNPNPTATATRANNVHCESHNGGIRAGSPVGLDHVNHRPRRLRRFFVQPAEQRLERFVRHKRPTDNQQPYRHYNFHAAVRRARLQPSTDARRVGKETGSPSSPNHYPNTHNNPNVHTEMLNLWLLQAHA